MIALHAYARFNSSRVGLLAKEAKRRKRVEHKEPDVAKDMTATASDSSESPLLVTGATGHVGANLMHLLLKNGARVRVLLKPGDNHEAVEGLPVERAYGDIRDLDATQQAVAGCKGVYHVAALVSTIDGNQAHQREIFETNVLGTRHVLQAAREHDAGRVVVTGSFSAVGYNLDDLSAPSNETMTFFPMERTTPYQRSKALTELECWRAAAAGQDVVVTTSCAVLGGNDYLPSRVGRTLCDFANRKLRRYVDGGFEWVTAQDIAQGHVLSMKNGRTGEKYIICSGYYTISEILDFFQDVTGVKRPNLRVPTTFLMPLAEVSSYVMSRYFPSRPQRFTPGAIRILQKRRHGDSTKARNELGFEPTSVRNAIAEAYAFHYERGDIHNPAAKAPEAVASTDSND